MSSIKSDLQKVAGLEEWALKDLEADENIGAMPDLLRALLALEEHYKEFCLSMDDNYQEPDGTTYRDGINIEFYIEASDWHDISVALRKWQEAHPDWPEMLNMDVDSMIDMPVLPPDTMT